MPTVRGRDTANYRRLRAAFRRNCARARRPCWLCQQPLDYTLPSDDPFSFSLDHVKPVSKYREESEDIRLFQPSHLKCNKSRGARPPPLDLGQPSRDW
jgi:hypothetical protein